MFGWLGNKKANIEGRIAGVSASANPNTGKVSTSVLITNNGQVPAYYDVEVRIKRAGHWQVAYSATTNQVLPRTRINKLVVSDPLVFGKGDSLTITAKLYTSTGVPLDSRETSITSY